MHKSTLLVWKMPPKCSFWPDIKNSLQVSIIAQLMILMSCSDWIIISQILQKYNFNSLKTARNHLIGVKNRNTIVVFQILSISRFINFQKFSWYLMTEECKIPFSYLYFLKISSVFLTQYCQMSNRIDQLAI